MKKNILIIGTMYLDINCINFPFDNALYAHRETVGDKYLLDVGGSALNFARMIQTIGGNPIMVGKIGKDKIGDILEKLIIENKIVPALVTDQKTQTNLAVHYIHEDGKSIMSSCGSANQNLDYDSIVNSLKEHGEVSDFLYIGGLFKLKRLLPDIQKLLKEVKKINKQIKIVLDHGRVNNTVTFSDKKTLYEVFPLIDIYLPSHDEFLDVWEENTIPGALKRMKSIADPITVIKQGEKGALGLKNDQMIELPSFHVAPINTVGAGDSFNAGFIVALAEGKSFREAIHFANATAALKISQRDIPSRPDIEKLLN